MTRKCSRTIALIAGTGLVLDVPLAEARAHSDVAVKFGADSGRVLSYVEGFHEDLRVVLLPRHGPTLERPDRSPAMLVNEKGHEAHIWLLHQLEVSAVYAFSAVGALDREVPLASEMCFVVPNDYGRGLGATTHSFGERARTVHPSMREPFSPALRARAASAIEAVGAKAIPKGLYIYSGPDQFEADAEVRALMRLYQGESHRLVGMSAGPELVLCRQMEIPYVAICANANYAQGVASERVTHELVLKRMRVVAKKLCEIAAQIVRIEASVTQGS